MGGGGCTSFYDSRLRQEFHIKKKSKFAKNMGCASLIPLLHFQTGKMDFLLPISCVLNDSQNGGKDNVIRRTFDERRFQSLPFTDVCYCSYSQSMFIVHCVEWEKSNIIYSWHCYCDAINE